MKKLMNTIVNLTNKIYSNAILRILFYFLVIAAVVAVFLFTDGQKIEFVYNDF